MVPTEEILHDPPGGASPLRQEDELLPGIPALQVDASTFTTHRRKVMGNVVRGELSGKPVLELDLLALPRGIPAVRTAEAEWRALLLALRVARTQRRYRGLLQVLTDAQSSVHAWENGRGADMGWEVPPLSWRKGVRVLWVRRTRIAETDHALRFWTRFLVPLVFGGSLPDIAHAFGAEEIPKEEPFRVRLSLQGAEVKTWLERGPSVVRGAAGSPTH